MHERQIVSHQQDIKKSRFDRLVEISKWLDIGGMGVGMAMIALGFITLAPVMVTSGGILAGTSAVTYLIADTLQRRVHRQPEGAQTRRSATVDYHPSAGPPDTSMI